MNTALKRVMDELYTLADPNGASVSGAAASTSTEREQLKTEFIDFMSYLSSSDGTISESEAQFISEYFGQSFTPEELRTYVEKNGTYSTAFEKKAPKTLERFVAQDNALFKQRLELASSASASYIDVFDSWEKSSWSAMEMPTSRRLRISQLTWILLESIRESIPLFLTR